MTSPVPPTSGAPVRMVTIAEVRLTFLRVILQRVIDLDRVRGCILRACMDRLTGVFMEIFHLSQPQSEIPTCFKTITIIPVSKVACPNYYHSENLTSIIVNCFETLVMHTSSPATQPPLIHCNLPITTGPRHAISLDLQYLVNKDTYIRFFLLSLCFYRYHSNQTHL